jgi:S1-C subfamily serine protease
MITRNGLLFTCCAGVFCAFPAAAQEGKEHADRITPIVRVVQKCQGSVVAFINPQTGKAMGTGVIVHAQGVIVTNAHVVGKTKTWKLQLIDKTEMTGDVLNVVGENDLAVVKVNPPKKLEQGLHWRRSYRHWASVWLFVYDHAWNLERHGT